MSVTEPGFGWTTTGLYWQQGSAALAASGPDGSEYRVPVAPGMDFGWQAAPPRRCVGLWRPATGRRLPCPHRQPIPPDGAGAQCPACAAADPGRALARDHAPDDDREFVLYLAWFGGELFKVGLTAAERGSDRLAEQGALAFTGLARGGWAPIRGLERQTAAAGLARERISWPAKIAHWWALPDREDRRAAVESAHGRIHAGLSWPDTVQPLPCRVSDQVAAFGLDRPPPASYRPLLALRSGGALTGRTVALVGRRLLLDIGAGHVLADLRLLAGWRWPEPVDGPTRDVDLGPTQHPHNGRDHAQDTLV